MFKNLLTQIIRCRIIHFTFSSQFDLRFSIVKSAELWIRTFRILEMCDVRCVMLSLNVLPTRCDLLRLQLQLYLCLFLLVYYSVISIYGTKFIYLNTNETFECLNELIAKCIDHWWHLNSIILQILSSIINCGFWLLSKHERFNDTFHWMKNIKLMLDKDWMNKQTNTQIQLQSHTFDSFRSSLTESFYPIKNIHVRTKWLTNR